MMAVAKAVENFRDNFLKFQSLRDKFQNPISLDKYQNPNSNFNWNLDFFYSSVLIISKFGILEFRI